MCFYLVTKLKPLLPRCTHVFMTNTVLHENNRFPSRNKPVALEMLLREKQRSENSLTIHLSLFSIFSFFSCFLLFTMNIHAYTPSVPPFPSHSTPGDVDHGLDDLPPNIQFLIKTERERMHVSHVTLFHKISSRHIWQIRPHWGTQHSRAEQQLNLSLIVVNSTVPSARLLSARNRRVAALSIFAVVPHALAPSHQAPDGLFAVIQLSSQI